MTTDPKSAGTPVDPEFEPEAPDTPGTWQERCSVLYQVIGALANQLGVFETSHDVSDALDVAAGRGNVANLLPWPKSRLAAHAEREGAEPLCLRCKGAGEIEVMEGVGDQGYPATVECPSCNGTGIPSPAPDSQADESDDDIRTRFESWAARQNLTLKRKGGSYASTYGAWCWEAFYAASRIRSQPAPSAASGLANDVIERCAEALEHFNLGGLATDLRALRSHQAPVGEDAAHSFSASETDRLLLGAYTPTSYPYGYPWYLNLTMLRMAGDVILTVRASPSAWGKDAHASSVRFTREMWREFAKLFESANKVYEAADSLDAEM